MKKQLMILAMTAVLGLGSITSVGATNYWNGLANFPEVENSASGSESYFFDVASQFSGIDESRNFVFGINVINMHNNQYGEAGLYKYQVIPSTHIVYRYMQDGSRVELEAGTSEYAMFLQAWKLVYGHDYRPDNLMTTGPQ